MTWADVLVSVDCSRVHVGMTDTVFEFEYTLSEVERAESHPIVSREVFGVFGQWSFAIALFACLASSITVGLVLIDEPGVAVAELAMKFVVVGVVSALVFHFVLQYFSASVLQARQKDFARGQMTRMTIDQTGISVERGKSTSVMSWQDVLTVSERQGWIVLALAPTAYVLPERLFENADKRELAIERFTAWHKAARAPGPWG